MLGLIQSTLTITNKTNVNPLDYMTSPAPSPVANPDPAHPTITTPQVPSAFIYLLNIFSKSIIRQFKEEASVNPRAAQKIGKAASMLFAKPSITYHHRSMISILLAKFRKEIPILFGVRGSEATERGRTAINWARMGDGSWVDSGVHNNTMTGLAAGFSAIGLRSYALSQMNNPCPPVIWWNAFAAVTRHNGQPVENTHYTILKALVEHNEMVIKNFFGDRGLAAFVNAIYVFPSKAKNPNSPEVLSVVAYWEKLYRITGMSLQRIRTGPQPVLNEVYPDWAKPVAQPPGRPGW